MGRNSIAGCTAPICHGSGVANKTLSDFITEIYYMDAHGQHRHITDAAQIKAAAGGLGVYGSSPPRLPSPINSS
jgi:hypothetical protein